MNIDWTNEVGVFLTVIGSLILAYGGARFGAVLFGELRNAILLVLPNWQFVELLIIHLLNY